MTDALAAHVPLAVTTRSGHTECVHHGSLVVLGPDGSVRLALGDPAAPIYPRSATKPFQSVAMVDAGLHLPDRLLALACASHGGLPEHVAGTREILALGGFDESALANTPDLPYDPVEAEAEVRRGGHPTSILMNCSGKHAAMLVTSAMNGWPTDEGYLDPHHPLQTRATSVIADMADEQPTHIGVDGCGAPAHMVSLIGLARAYGRLRTAAVGSSARRVADAMTAHPGMVGGPRQDPTIFMRAVPGLLAKEGAEGVMAACLPDGSAVALKVADGAARARPALLAAALVHLGVSIDDASLWRRPVLGHGRPVGEVVSLLP